MKGWKSIPCKISELRLDITLACGQSFRWHETVPGQWTSVLQGWILSLKQTDEEIMFKVHNDNEENDTQLKTDQNPKLDVETQCADILKDYFQLHISIGDLYAHWCEADEKFKSTASSFSGVRILRQDPVENLFSFICSSNNHISRISGMVERMCKQYGVKLLEQDGHEYYSFPTIDSLRGAKVEEKLRTLGFGYRAKYINQSAKQLHEMGGREWLFNLRELPYEEAKKDLMKLQGVGAKVADCVCLMSLDKTGCIPVDTHVWQFAARDYMPKLKQSKSLTDSLYKEIGVHFRDLWGEYAGWAHSVLFSAELKQFQSIKNQGQTEKKSGKRASKIDKTTSKPKKRRTTKR